MKKPVQKLSYNPFSPVATIKALSEERRQNKMSVEERRRMNNPSEPEAVHRGMETSRGTGVPLPTSVIPPSDMYGDPYDPSGWNPTPIDVDLRKDWRDRPNVRWSDDPSFREKWHYLFYVLATLLFVSLCLAIFMYWSRPTINMSYQRCGT